MAIAYIVRHVSKVGVLFAPSKKPTLQKLSNVSMCIGVLFAPNKKPTLQKLSNVSMCIQSVAG